VPWLLAEAFAGACPLTKAFTNELPWIPAKN
jgi:hypothetical protein